MKSIKVWVLCANDADEKYIKVGLDGCLAIFDTKKAGNNAKGLTPNTDLHEKDYVSLSDYAALVKELEAVKSGIPKIKADAIRSVTEQGFEYAVALGPYDTDWAISQDDIIQYANSLINNKEG